MTPATLVRACLVAPGLAWTALIAATVAGGSVGVAPLAPAPPLTLSESVALRDHATVVWSVRQGVDPNARYDVRPGILRPRLPASVTPLEAAIAARQLATLQLLVELGAVVHDGNVASLVCFARSRRDDQVVAYLETRRPGRAVEVCEGVATPY